MLRDRRSAAGLPIPEEFKDSSVLFVGMRRRHLDSRYRGSKVGSDLFEHRSWEACLYASRRHALYAAAPLRYQVQLAFSQEGTNAKLSGVKVTMIDYKGDKALEKVIDGPIFFATPPAGRWTLKAEYAGETFSKTVDVNGRFYISLNVQFKAGRQGN